MAKKHRRIPLNDSNHFDLAVRMECVRDTLLLVRDVLLDEISSETPMPLRNTAGAISVALKEIEAINKVWDTFSVPDPRDAKDEQAAPTVPAARPNLRLVVAENDDAS
jgi:hypothetical protein